MIDEATIIALLRRHIGTPQSVEEIAAELNVRADEIAAQCASLRERGVLGRNGAGEPGRPFRFYLKNRGKV